MAQLTGRRAWRRTCAALLLLVACAACGADAVPDVRFSTIVLVGIDGMRSDHLGSGDYPRDTSPFLDALAERSVSFERAYAASSRSLASYASLLTGRAPGEHGLWGDSGGALRDPGPTLPERLAERGYRTAAFVSTRRDWEATGVPRGFAHFAAPGPFFQRRYRRGGDTVDAALDWLAAEGAHEPRFLFVQLEDPTKPLDPLPEPAAWAVAGVEPDELIRFKLESHRVPFGYFNYENRQLLRLVNRYDGELRSADAALSRLYASMKDGGGAGALWVVTSPHGMGLGNHLWDGATRQIYEVQVRVPLFFHAPGGELPARVSQTVVSQLDLADAVVALADGSKAPLEDLLGGERPGPRGAFVQRGVLDELPRAVNRPGRPEADPGQQDAWIEARWKYVRHSDGAESVYDVAADRYETQDRLKDVDSETLERLRAALAAERTARALSR